MTTARARIDKAGRVLIPAEVRTELNLRPGASVVLETSGEESHIRPYRLAIREAQSIIRKYIPDRSRSLVDELVAQRRKEAERE